MRACDLIWCGCYRGKIVYFYVTKYLVIVIVPMNDPVEASWTWRQTKGKMEIMSERSMEIKAQERPYHITLYI